MEMASNDQTRAFAGHFGGTLVPADLYEGEDSSGSEDVDGSMEMEEADGITRAFQPQAQALGGKPRFSEVVRQEDAEDEEIRRQLAEQEKGGKTRGTVMFGGVGDESEEEGDDVESEGEIGRAHV